MDNVKTYRARTMPEALKMVKKDLGSDAVILGTRTVPAGGLGGIVAAQQIEISAGRATAGPDAAKRRRNSIPVRRGRDAMTQTTLHAAGDGASALREEVYPFYLKLVQNEVGEELARRIAIEAAGDQRRPANPDELRNAIRAAIERMLPVAGGIELEAGKCRRVALVGPAGAGKTTTLAKLAAQFKLRQGKRVALVSLDLHSVANNDPIRRYAEIIGVPLYTPQTVASAKDALRSVSDYDLVLIDTCGLGPRDKSRLVRLAALHRAMRPCETHLVLPASMLRSAQARMLEQYAPLGASRLVLTRLDEVVGIGVVLNALEPLHLGLSYTTDGQNVPNDISSVCSREIAQLLFE